MTGSALVYDMVKGQAFETIELVKGYGIVLY